MVDTATAQAISGLLQKIPEVRVLVLGDMILDHYIWGDALRLSPEAPVPVVHVERDSYRVGGAGNVALNLRALGAHTKISGMLGADEAGGQLRELLKEAGVDLKAVREKRGVRTIVKTRVVARSQQLLRIDREDVPDNYTFTDTPELDASEFDAVILSDYAKGVVSSDLLRDVQRLAGRNLVAYDPKPRRRLHYGGLGLMTPNRMEALELAGMELSPAEKRFPAEEVCLRIFEEYRPRYLVITLGADGMLLCENGTITGQIQAYAREVFDVSGAGDTVIATLTAALAAGASLHEAAHLANTAAGIVVGKFGTAVATPEEIRSWHER